MNWMKESKDGIILTIRVVPRASKNEISGELGDAIKIRLQAPPVEGKANKALIQFLSDALNIQWNRISILSGDTGRNKRVLIRGISAEELQKVITSA